MAKLRKTQIFTLISFVGASILSYMLYDSIASKIKEDAEIKLSEQKVRDRLIAIREAEKAFLNANKRYTANWDSLIAFVKTGEVYNVQKKETIIPRPANQAHLGDSVRITYDTLGKDPVLTKIFPMDKFPNFNPDELPNIPLTDGKKFTITVGKIMKSGVSVDVVQVIDEYPKDKTRKKEHENPKRRFLGFGSMEDVSLGGNWED